MATWTPDPKKKPAENVKSFLAFAKPTLMEALTQSQPITLTLGTSVRDDVSDVHDEPEADGRIRCCLVGVHLGDRPKLIGGLQDGQELRLFREHTNAFSAHAVAVATAEGQVLGYVPDNQWHRVAPLVAKLLDEKRSYVATVERKALLKRGLTPVVCMKFEGSLPEVTKDALRGFAEPSQDDIKKMLDEVCR